MTIKVLICADKESENNNKCSTKCSSSIYTSHSQSVKCGKATPNMGENCKSSYNIFSVNMVYTIQVFTFLEVNMGIY